MIDVCPVYVIPWWQWHPPVGSWIAMLALLGVIVPWLFRPPDKMGRTEKAIWTFVMLLFLVLELRTLYLDRDEHDREQAHASCEQLKRFQAIADTLSSAISANQTQFQLTMQKLSEDETSRQNQFNATMGGFSTNEASSQIRFDKLIEHEEKVADAQSGILSPDNLPLPANTCQDVPPDATFIFLGSKGNAAWFTGFPHVVVGSKSHGPVLSIERTNGNSIAVIFDLRSPDGKIVARMDASGYVVNRNNTLEIKKTEHNLAVVDLYGQEVLDVQYLNSHALSIRGENIEMPMFTNGCFGGGETSIQLP